VDVSTLEDYKSFKRIDNEGKYLFDFVTISIWNARKQLVDWLSPHFNEKDELVDLFYPKFPKIITMPRQGWEPQGHLESAADAWLVRS